MQSVKEIELGNESEEGGADDNDWRERGVKGHVDKSRGMETLIAEELVQIKPTEPLRWAKQAARRKRSWSDSSGNSPAKKKKMSVQEKQAQKVTVQVTRCVHDEHDQIWLFVCQ